MSRWYKGKASCILLRNVGDALRQRRNVRGCATRRRQLLELGVVTAEGRPVGPHDRAHGHRHRRKSPFVQATKAHTVTVKLNREVLYELDGGDRHEDEIRSK